LFDIKNRVEYGKSMGELRTIHPSTELDVSNVNVVHRKPSLREKVGSVTKDAVTGMRGRLAHPGDSLLKFVATRLGLPRNNPF
jgi:hypothetical protein